MRIELSGDIPVYTGRIRGREDRARFRIPALDDNDEAVEIVVPDSVYTMTSSYFLAFLGDSVRKLGKSSFLAKYRLVGPEHVTKKVDDWIARALREKKGLFGGGT